MYFKLCRNKDVLPKDIIPTDLQRVMNVVKPQLKVGKPVSGYNSSPRQKIV